MDDSTTIHLIPDECNVVQKMLQNMFNLDMNCPYRGLMCSKMACERRQCINIAMIG